jgi:ribonuclease VapC
VLFHKLGEPGVRDLEQLIRALSIEVVPHDEAQLGVAMHGYRIYGKGRHPASLNFGDGFAYALAKTRDEPLLFKGNDFSQTGIIPAMTP